MRMPTTVNRLKRTITRKIKSRKASDQKLLREKLTKHRRHKRTSVDVYKALVADVMRIAESKLDPERRTIIMAHRGGNFGPGNSMKNFRGAI